MKVTELEKVLSALETKGFQNNAAGFHKKTRTSNYHSPSSGKAIVQSNIAHKIRAIWIDMAKHGVIRDSSEQALNAWVRSVVNPIYKKQGTNILVLNVGALNDQMASIVLERLKKWQARGNV